MSGRSRRKGEKEGGEKRRREGKGGQGKELYLRIGTAGCAILEID